MQNKWYNKALLNDDPIAQTFRVTPEMCPDADGLYITSFSPQGSSERRLRHYRN